MANQVPSRVGTTRPGGRTARTRQLVLDAALAELVDRGVAGLSIERIAQRAGIHATTIRRRWGTIAAVLAEAGADIARTAVPVPDTGSLAGDIGSLTSSVVAALARDEVRQLVRAMITFTGTAEKGAADSDSGGPASRLLQDFFAVRHRAAAELVERAVRRGELPGSTDGLAVLEAVAAPIYFRTLVSGAPTDGAFQARLTHQVATAARSGLFAAPPD